MLGRMRMVFSWTEDISVIQDLNVMLMMSAPLWMWPSISMNTVPKETCLTIKIEIFLYLPEPPLPLLSMSTFCDSFYNDYVVNGRFGWLEWVSIQKNKYKNIWLFKNRPDLLPSKSTADIVIKHFLLKSYVNRRNEEKIF